MVIEWLRDESACIISNTTDGGLNWSSQSFYDHHYRNLQYINDSTCFFTDDSLLYRSVDTCNTWFEISNFPKKITSYCANSDNTIYVLCRSEILYSESGGAIWNKKWIVPTLGFRFNGFNVDFQIFNNDIIYLLHSGNNSLLKSIDNGESWDLRNLSCPLTSVAVSSENNIIISDKYYIPPQGVFHSQPYSNLYYSSDGGNSWSVNLSVSGIFKKCILINDKLGFALTESDFYKTNDGGISWNTNLNFVRIIDFFFLNENLGWLIAADGFKNAIFKTNDGGNNWDITEEIEFNDVGGSFKSICFVDENNGWIAGESGVSMFDSTYGWIDFIPFTENKASEKIEFYDSKIGFILSWMDQTYLELMMADIHGIE